MHKGSICGVLGFILLVFHSRALDACMFEFRYILVDRPTYLEIMALSFKFEERAGT